MLINLEVNDFAIVDKLDIDWKSGMTSITGETGAGKSIAIDALSMALGERAAPDSIRPGTDKAQIVAHFDIASLPNAQKFLNDNLLNTEDNECILRRVISKNGRSKSYINGISVAAAQLRELGQYLVSIHGQHAHQLLLKPEHQLDLLDAYAGHDHLIEKLKNKFYLLKKLSDEHKKLLIEQKENTARKQLLEYQVEELDDFALSAGEFKIIESEHSRLCNSQKIIETCHQELQILFESDSVSILSQLQNSVQQFRNIANFDPELINITKTLEEGALQIEEASREIRHYSQNIEQDPMRLQELDERMSKAMDLARKHHINPNDLYDLHIKLRSELQSINSGCDRLTELNSEILIATGTYKKNADILSKSRAKSAEKLTLLISKSMNDLSMKDGQFFIKLITESMSSPSPKGVDGIDFLVSTNPGQPLQSLGKVASGGELSRISLAIQVIIAKKVTTPTLIFDEVDVGISGPTAAKVGKMLRRLGNETQVVCVTHLPQVACSGHQQLFVTKKVKNNRTFTSMSPLEDDMRVNEIARLLGGDQLSQTIKASAKELLDVQSAS